jgi:hypothetical protein
MAKRRKVGLEEGTVECFYCKKSVPEAAWRCPNCGRWYREGIMGALGIAAIVIIAILLVLYVFQPSIFFGGEGEESEKRYGVALYLDTGPQTHKAELGGYTEWGFRVSSAANAADTIEFTSEGASQLQVTFERTFLPLGAGANFLNTVKVDVPDFTPLDSYDFTVYGTSRSDPNVFHFLHLTVDVESLPSRTVGPDDKIMCHYIRWTEEGTFGESSYERGEPFGVSINSDNADATYGSVIDGFSEGFIDMKAGETRLVVVPPDKGYHENPDHEMYGKTLIFQLELISIDT